MKANFSMIAAALMAMTASGQDTNGLLPKAPEDLGRPEHRQRWPEPTPEQKEEIRQRRLQLMERELKEIGVTDEQKTRIFELQGVLQEKMRDNMERQRIAREKLSRLQDEGASMEAIDAAIKELADIQAEQLRILVKNRMELEGILGKEKYDLFMERARVQFRKHGRRGGPEMPPRPGLPPMPEEGEVPPPPSPDEVMESAPPAP